MIFMECHIKELPYRIFMSFYQSDLIMWRKIYRFFANVLLSIKSYIQFKTWSNITDSRITRIINIILWRHFLEIFSNFASLFSIQRKTFIKFITFHIQFRGWKAWKVVDKSHKNNFVYLVIMLYAWRKFLLLMSSKLYFYCYRTENKSETSKFYDQVFYVINEILEYIAWTKNNPRKTTF